MRASKPGHGRLLSGLVVVRYNALAVPQREGAMPAPVSFHKEAISTIHGRHDIYGRSSFAVINWNVWVTAIFQHYGRCLGVPLDRWASPMHHQAPLSYAALTHLKPAIILRSSHQRMIGLSFPLQASNLMNLPSINLTTNMSSIIQVQDCHPLCICPSTRRQWQNFPLLPLFIIPRYLFICCPRYMYSLYPAYYYLYML